MQGLSVLGPNYATITGIVGLTDDPDGSFHQEVYDIHMGGAAPPPEPGVGASDGANGPSAGLPATGIRVCLRRGQHGRRRTPFNRNAQS